MMLSEQQPKDVKPRFDHQVNILTCAEQLTWSGECLSADSFVWTRREPTTCSAVPLCAYKYMPSGRGDRGRPGRGARTSGTEVAGRLLNVPGLNG